MNPFLEQAGELLAAARRDQTTLRVLLKDADSPIEAELFHAQQAIEKAIKAVLVCHGVMFRRTHDLLELADITREHGIDVPVPADLLLRLGPYAVEFRYLGVRAPDVSPDEANTAVNAAVAWADGCVSALNR